ncbi:hypothetical protein CHS0354_021903 [Potamilus streckersoni]|uniref:Amino acid permease n=1 Tax=Potamilus streckersoni TaxID=2493646 RepID=A0AAE0TKL8_9BIVA|nr:hypothetical protein CHS0354_021903 [Potamilus streckersoni]
MIETKQSSAEEEGHAISEKNVNSKQETERLQIKRRIGLFSSITFIVGAIIGSGIFVSPKGALLYSGSVGLTLVMWALCGLFSLLAALVYAELATMLPKSGGDYSYIMEAFGDCPAFLIFWAHAIIGSSSNVVLPLVFADYLCALLFGACGAPESIRRMIAAIEMRKTIITC